jgi:hypothetical protein
MQGSPSEKGNVLQPSRADQCKTAITLVVCNKVRKLKVHPSGGMPYRTSWGLIQPSRQIVSSGHTV